MKCAACGYERGLVDVETDPGRCKLRAVGDEEFIRTDKYIHVKKDGNLSSYTEELEIHICPKCGTLKVEI